MFYCLLAFLHQSSESAADDFGGHASFQQEEGNGQFNNSPDDILCKSDSYLFDQRYTI